MRTVLEWKCGHCNSVQKSDSGERWKMDLCSCGKSGVDLEEFYQRACGEVVILNTTAFGELKGEGINEGLNEGIKDD
jgi:hypothetical protein